MVGRWALGVGRWVCSVPQPHKRSHKNLWPHVVHKIYNSPEFLVSLSPSAVLAIKLYLTLKQARWRRRKGVCVSVHVCACVSVSVKLFADSFKCSSSLGSTLASTSSAALLMCKKCCRTLLQLQIVAELPQRVPLEYLGKLPKRHTQVLGHTLAHIHAHSHTYGLLPCLFIYFRLNDTNLSSDCRANMHPVALPQTSSAPSCLQLLPHPLSLTYVVVCLG